MEPSLVSLPLWIELTAIVAGAMPGAVYAASRGLDAVGVGAMAMVGGLGGGVLRDLLLGTVPLVLVTPAYLYTVVGAALIGMFFGSVVERLHIVLAIVDTLRSAYSRSWAPLVHFCLTCPSDRRSCSGSSPGLAVV